MRVAVSALLLGATLLAEGKPSLLHANEACFVHAVAAWPGGFPVEDAITPGHQILHTVRATGEMTVLVPPTGTVSIATRRRSYGASRILGVAADAERLYVLTWQVRHYDKPLVHDAPVRGGTYLLKVFWLADGRALAAPTLAPEGLPGEASAETLAKGPLRAVPGGVECFGTMAAYEGAVLRH